MHHGAQLSLDEVELPSSHEHTFAPLGWQIIRLSQGAAYCFADQRVIDLATGELIVVPPAKTVILRANQIGTVRMHHFEFQPQFLGSFLTLFELHRFAELAAAPGREVCRFPVTDESARRFTAVCELPATESRLLKSCLLFVLAVGLFAPDLETHSESVFPGYKAKARFLEMFARMPEMELLKHSRIELAAACRCGQRQFSRLFEAHFGTTFRSKQAQLRMERARQLLLETDLAINDVGAASGYPTRNFRGAFKKRFGLTPAQLRQQTAREEGQKQFG